MCVCVCVCVCSLLSSVQFSHSVMSDSSLPHELQHSRPPCLSPTPRVYSNSCQLSQWCHSNHLILCLPFRLLPSIFPSIKVFSRVSSSHQVAKVLEFQHQHQSFNEHSWLIFFRMDWLDLLAVQGTLKSLPQHHSSKASILRCSAFFIVKLLRPYMTTGKTIALTRQTFVGKVMSLLLNMLSRFVIAFLPRSKCFLISWLQSLYATIWFWSSQNKICYCFHFSPFCLPWSDGTKCHDLGVLNAES